MILTRNKKGGRTMKEDTKDIKSLSELLTRENKRYVIAVANALLFSQKREEEICKATTGRST